MSHHPSSAELAAFRRSIAHDPRYLDTIRWQDERGHGIGYRIPLQDGDAGVLSIARREASASRSRAYARGIGSLADVQTFAPSWPPYLDADPTWSAWTDDEPRSPLPIRYQPSFIITR